MPQLSTPRILIGGVASGVGKSALCLGLIQELRRRGMAVSCAVASTDIVQSLIYKRFTGFTSVSLDPALLASEQCLMSAYLGSLGSELLLIDGSGGLFDAHGQDPSGACDADIAAIIGAPVALVCDVRGIARSVAAIIHGYQSFFGRTPISPLFNFGQTADRNMFSKLCIDNGFQKPLGVVPHRPLVEPTVFPHGSNQRGAELRVDHQVLLELGALARDHLDIEALISAAESAPVIELNEAGYEPGSRRARIAYAEDPCFGICFQNNLAILRHLGADLVQFSPLLDSELPAGCGGVYLPGGSIEEYSKDLADNTAMADELRSFADQGGVVYAESGGTAWLSTRIKGEDGKSWSGVGLLPGTAMAKRGRKHLISGAVIEESIFGAPGPTFTGIDTEEWQFDGIERVPRALQIGRSKGSPSTEGYCPAAQVLCTRALINFASSPELARAFVDSVEVAQKSPVE